MRLGTLRTNGGTVAVRIDENSSATNSSGEADAVEIDGYEDVGALIRSGDATRISAGAAGTRHPLDGIAPTDWAPVIPSPGKIICVGLNYANHIREMGRELPKYPTLFAKYPEALIGAADTIVLPPEAADHVDWEGELAFVVGKTARRVAAADAGAYIAGYSVLNDVTMRDYQYRSPQWMQGKTFEASTPFGPWLATPDEFTLGPTMRTEVDGEVVQSTPTNDLVFPPAALVEYISTILTLNPGDVVATGTPGGVGHARKPARYLRDGNVLTTTIEGLGVLRNPVTAS